MVEIWSPRAKVLLEREFWIAVMRAQRALGLDDSGGGDRRLRAREDAVDLDSIRARERVTRHDVKARIDEFCALAGYEHIHKGLTSRDLTENVEQLQVLRVAAAGADQVRRPACAIWRNGSASTAPWSSPAARTTSPAQATTVGKRLAMFGDRNARRACRRSRICSRATRCAA